MTDVTQAIEQSVSLTIQDKKPDIGGGLANISLVSMLSRASYSLPPWWSKARDMKMAKFWKTSDHLSGAVYSMQSKMTAIPNKVIAKDPSNKAHVKQAEMLTDILNNGSEWGDGWVSFYGKFVEDLITQDNGAFAEVIGEGPKTGAIVGRPISVAHLDSARCTRTGHPIYPVIYQSTDNKRYKLHYTRVMLASQMASPRKEMNSVGFCSVSRCVNVTQTLIDILVYKQEKLGSRPHRQLIITKGGLDPDDIRNAFSLAEAGMDSQGLSRYSKVIVGGSSSLPESGVEVIELSQMPDGFDEQTSITLGMATIALAFGVDARDLFPAMSAGSTRADALLQHLKQRGKGPGQILQITERQFDYKFLPPHLDFIFDFQDDAQDRQEAEIREIRANKRVQDKSTEAVNERTMHEQMVEDGDVSRSQFERLELDSGRLPGGTSVLTLFYSKKPEISQYLKMGVKNPLDVYNNSVDGILSAIVDNRAKVMEALANTASPNKRWYAMQAEAALDYLEIEYIGEKDDEFDEGTTGNWIDDRVRTVDLTQPTQNDTAPQESLKPHADDKPKQRKKAR